MDTDDSGVSISSASSASLSLIDGEVSKPSAFSFPNLKTHFRFI